MKATICVIFIVAVAAAVAAMNDEPYNMPTTTVDVTKSSGLRADSDLGMKLLSHARRVEEGNNHADGGEQQQQQADYSWVAKFSLKFQACHHVQQFVDVEEGEDGGGGGVQVKRLVRFRLCPTDTCLSKKGVGCNYRYGDYVIGLETFVSIYYEYIKQVEEESCEQYLQGSCDCSGENQEEDFDANQCEYDCYAEAGMENICMGNRGDERDDYFDAERHMQCAELRWRNNEGKEEGGQGRRTAEEEQGLGLYVGPYCANQGSSIYLGMFTDAACSEFADNSQGKATFKSLTGTALPYSSQNIVTMDCVSCMDDSSNGQEGDGNNANNKNDAVAEMCQQLYNPAGKCEESIPEGMVQNRDSRACNYISGIQKVGQDGVVRNANSGPGAGTTFFIVLLVSIVLGMFMYVYYLRTRLAATEASKRMAFLEDQYREPPKYNLPRIH